MKTQILADFQICVSVLLNQTNSQNKVFSGLDPTLVKTNYLILERFLIEFLRVPS